MVQKNVDLSTFGWVGAFRMGTKSMKKRIKNMLLKCVLGHFKSFYTNFFYI